MRLPNRWRSILRPGKGAESCPEHPDPFQVSLLLPLAAQRGIVFATQGS